MINVTDAVWTGAVSCILMLSGGLALLALPWTDRDILRVHRAALRLWGRRAAPQPRLARQPLPTHRR